MKKKYTLICLIFLGFHTVSNAQAIPKTLLWKISGNGLQKASYLYGTLHLMDERIFNFGDSLYKAIENSEGFAIEVHPDEMTPYFIDMVKQEIKNARLIKEMVNEKEFKKYGPALSKKLNKSADKITTQDIFREKNKWLQDSYRSGKMPTIVDAYLFDIARRQGKWMGGVEDMADQKGLVDNLVDESDIKQIALSDKNNSKSYLENMIQVYINSDLNSIDSMMNFTDSTFRDALLIKRNKKMALRMDSLSRIRTMVFAVGAAHLPGSEGLINLLRAKGFTVEPVFYSKKIKSAEYKFQEVNIPWVSVDDPNGYYHVMMPGNPGDLKMYGVLDMKMYFNIFNSTGYLVASVNTPYEKEGVDSVLSEFAMNVFKEKKLQHAKDIAINNISGKELEKKDEEGYKRGFLLYKNNVIYMVVGFSLNGDAKSLSEVKRFLDSYQPKENIAKKDSKSYTYVDSVMAYKVELPSMPQSGNDLATATDKSMKSNLMVCIDQLSGSYFIFGVNQTTPGYSITNDSASLQQIHNSIQSKYTNVTADTTFIKNNRRIMKFEGRLVGADVNAKAYYEFRGNRWYALIAMYGTSQPKPVVDKFLNSFEVLDYQPVLWKKQVAADSLFSAWAPAPIKYHGAKDSSSGYTSTRYEIYDTTRSDSYEVVEEDFGKYYWQNSDTALWNRLVKNLIKYKDTLLGRTDIQNGNIKGVEILKQEKGSFNTSRKRMLLYGDTLFTLATTQQTQNVRDDNVNKFFESLRFNRPAPTTHLYTSKAKVLLADLQQNDSATRSEARESFRIAPFRSNDLPMLHDALLKKYPVFTDEYESVNRIIANKIIGLKDSSSMNFARKNYLSVMDKEIKNLLLEIIARYKTKENYAALLNLLLQSPPLEQPSFSFLEDIKDSALLAATMFPGILPLLKDTVMAPGIIDVAADLIDSDRIDMDMLKSYQQDVLQIASWRHNKLMRDEDDDYRDYFILDLLGKFKNPTCNAMLQKWLRLDKNYIRLRCVAALVANGETIDKGILLKLAADKSYRLDMYNDLKKLQKLQLFPKQYLSQQNFAQSMVYQAAGEDDDEPSALSFLSQKIIPFKNKKARFFFYKITYDDGDEKVYRLACAGPFDTDATKMSTDKATGALYYEEEYNASNVEKQMDALIKNMEGWYKKDEKK